MGKKAVYIYGFDMPSCFKLKSLCAMNKVSLCKIINKDMTELTLGEIISGKTQEVSEQKELKSDPIILFNGFTEGDLQKLIKDIRKCPELKEAILAAVTSVSINWNFAYLVEHLMEEKANFQRAKK